MNDDSKKEIEEAISLIEKEMSESDFWIDKNRAQAKVKELKDLKDSLEGKNATASYGAIMTVFSGAGGDDAEDFSGMLVGMYNAYFKKNGWQSSVVHEHKNDHGGYRNITIAVTSNPSTSSGRSGPYGQLRNEAGVHRLVRISPFNSKKMRHTSFSLVEVVPILPKSEQASIRPEDIKVEFTRSGGPGGQNVNKRETAVRMTHVPTGITVHVSTERSQEQNREQALSLLAGKLHRFREAEAEKKMEAHYISKTTDIEWGNQIRSYVLHPYKMVKDHRTDVETSDVKGVLEEGELDEFIEAEKIL